MVKSWTTSGERAGAVAKDDAALDPDEPNSVVRGAVEREGRGARPDVLQVEVDGRQRRHEVAEGLDVVEAGDRDVPGTARPWSRNAATATTSLEAKTQIALRPSAMRCSAAA